MSNEAILLVGPTASGKTPLGEFLQRRGLAGRACRHFDFGENLRRAVAADHPPAGLTSKEVSFLRDVLSSGALLEDEHSHIAEALLRNFLDAPGTAANDWIILNGLPRHVGQAKRVDAMLPVRIVVELACDARTVFERIAGDPAGDRVSRSDDAPEDIRRKLAIFHERTAPLIEHYRSIGARIERLDVASDTKPGDLRETLESRLRRKH